MYSRTTSPSGISEEILRSLKADISADCYYEDYANAPWDPEEKEYVVPPYEEGKYAFVIDGLSSRTAYSAKIYFKASGIPGTVNDKCKFTTKSSYSGTYPYIILSGAERGSDGSFAKGTEIPLRVCNATDAEGVLWYFNDSEIAPSDDGYYHLKKSGTVRAEVIYSDGSKDVIVKEIIVK